MGCNTSSSKDKSTLTHVASRLLCRHLQYRDEEDYVKMIDVPDSYDGPQLWFLLNFTSVDILICSFKKEKILHAHYVLAVLSEAKKLLMKKSNISSVKTSPCKDITVCSDLHGKLDDLLLIFCKCAVLSSDSSIGTRGRESCPPNPWAPSKYGAPREYIGGAPNLMEDFLEEVTFKTVPSKHFSNLVILGCSYPEFSVFVNLNSRYGFAKEIMTKYTVYGRKILKILEEVYAWLPIDTIVDNEILILYGGISESTDLNFLSRLERSKIKSVLMPPIPSGEEVTTDFWRNRVSGQTYKPEVPLYERILQREWEQVIDTLWSDPRSKKGCYPNKNRGEGCDFGPDITTRILQKYRLKLLVRSHECKPRGYEISHEGKVITVFLASNYYEEGSNQGAFLKLGHCKPPTFVRYQVTKSPGPKPLSQRVNIIESSDIRILKERMMSQKIELVHAFKLQDRKDAGNKIM